MSEKKKKVGRPKREIEYQTFSCELPLELATEIREYCREKGLILNNFVKDALIERLEKLNKRGKK